jgi:transposase InsO family protein
MGGRILSVQVAGSPRNTQAQDFATQWLWTYNNDRPNMGIGGITPAMKLKMAA